MSIIYYVVVCVGVLGVTVIGDDSLYGSFHNRTGVCLTEITKARFETFPVTVTYWRTDPGWYGSSSNAELDYYTETVQRLMPYKENISTCCTGYLLNVIKNDEVKLSTGQNDYKKWCSPICGPPCGKNEECVAPDKCACQRGYAKSSGRCEPVCDPSCGNNEECVAPDKCACQRGYAKSSGRCEPVCDPSCGNNEECVAPDTCTCLHGYVKGSDKCKPVCDPSCGNNEECVAPDKCACQPGYVKSSDRCKPVCDPPCENAICVSPGTCSCYEGYEHSNASHCIPVCEPACGEGECVAPGQCKCHEGYRLLDPGSNQTSIANSSAACFPICDEGCINSDCVAPNTCRCHEGFTGVDGSQSVCDPLCEDGCLNGTCIAPDTCECFEGFRLDNDGFSCIPACVGDCENGQCLAPYTCICFDGYQLDDKSKSCFPVCNNGCFHGQCIEPDICECFDGYEDNNGTCEPICDTSCTNAVCSAPNVCSCLSGLLVHPLDNKTCLVPLGLRYLEIKTPFIFQHPIENKLVLGNPNSNQFSEESPLLTFTIPTSCNVIYKNSCENVSIEVLCLLSGVHIVCWLEPLDTYNNNYTSQYEQLNGTADVFAQTESVKPQLLTLLIPYSSAYEDSLTGSCTLCIRSPQERVVVKGANNVTFLIQRCWNPESHSSIGYIFLFVVLCGVTLQCSCFGVVTLMRRFQNRKRKSYYNAEETQLARLAALENRAPLNHYVEAWIDGGCE